MQKILQDTDTTSQSLSTTRPESPFLKPKQVDIGLSSDSLSEQQKLPKKATPKPEAAISTDSLAIEDSNAQKRPSKISPTLQRSNKAPANPKKSPLAQRSPLSLARRPQNSLQNSTAASRSRMAAISSTYHGAPNLRKNLLDAAKTPDVGTIRQQQSQAKQVLPRQVNPRREPPKVNHDSPSKRLPKLSGAPKRPTALAKKAEAKPKQNGDLPKHLTVGSRSGTFLKDEPTVLKKADIQAQEIDV